MNLPNKLTLFRIVLIPLFLIFINFDTQIGILLALVTFVVASITDQLDGYIARKYNLISDFGKFMDPLADKLLVSAAFISFIELGLVGAVPVIIIIFREFIITGIRLVLSSKGGKVIAANTYGKFKTVFQILAIIFILIEIYLAGFEIVSIHSYSIISYISFVADITFYICVILTILSGVDYIVKNFKSLKEIL